MLCRPDTVLAFIRIVLPASTALRRLESPEEPAIEMVTLERFDLSSFEVLDLTLQAVLLPALISHGLSFSPSTLPSSFIPSQVKSPKRSHKRHPHYR